MKYEKYILSSLAKEDNLIKPLPQIHCANCEEDDIFYIMNLISESETSVWYQCMMCNTINFILKAELNG